MRQIPLGAKGPFSLFVQPEHLADRFKDAILPPVFAMSAQGRNVTRSAK